MRVVYFVFNESTEAEAMFSADGKLLDYWYTSDATWRDEYFNRFMQTLGVEVKRPPAALHKKMLKLLQEKVAGD